MSENSHLIPEQYVPDLDTSAVWTVKYVDPSGFVCQLSLEAASGTEVMRKGQLVIERLKETQCSPVVRNNSNAQSQDEDVKGESICRRHHCEMRLYQKNNRSWYAHKTQDGHWCNGR